MNTVYKLEIVNACKEILQNKIIFLQQTLLEATNAGNNETKSTAGDKHETGRAMMQLEQEKLGNQLLELEKQLTEFYTINFDPQSELIKNGSLVETNNGLFLFATAVGKLECNGKVIYAISTKAPLGLVLLGLKPKNKIMFNNLSYQIISMC